MYTLRKSKNVFVYYFKHYVIFCALKIALSVLIYATFFFHFLVLIGGNHFRVSFGLLCSRERGGTCSGLSE